MSTRSHCDECGSERPVVRISLEVFCYDNDGYERRLPAPNKDLCDSCLDQAGRIAQAAIKRVMDFVESRKAVKADG